MYYLVFNMLNEWFIDRRGLALGELFYPSVFEVYLGEHGAATTLRVNAVALALLVVLYLHY